MKIISIAALAMMPLAKSVNPFEQQQKLSFNTPDELYDLLDFTMYHDY
jgi:hypothetical protein